MEEKNIIFRKEALEELSAPDRLSDYLRVSRPMVWAAIAAIAAVLTGLTVWAFAGTFSVTVSGKANVSHGKAEVILEDNSQHTLNKGMKVFTPDDEEMTITSVGPDEFERTVGYSETNIGDGVYDVSIIVGSKRPIDLLFGE